MFKSKLVSTSYSFQSNIIYKTNLDMYEVKEQINHNCY